MHDFIIVGSNFGEFSNEKNVLSINNCYDIFNENPIVDKISFGQGLTIDEVFNLKEKMSTFNSSISFDDTYSFIPDKLVHKQKTENNLIAKLEKKENEKYKCMITVQRDNELISDHVTGIHIPGMVLVEAARQFLIAIVECEGYCSQRFILKSISSKFENYVFPVAAEMEGKVVIDGNKFEHSVSAEIFVMQGMRRCMSIEAVATLVPEKIARFNEELTKKTFMKKYNNE